MFRNKLICGDNLQELVAMDKESVDLIYIDPPFFSNKNYEIIWGDEAEIRSFDDRWEGGIEVYIDWMKQRIEDIGMIDKWRGKLGFNSDGDHFIKPAELRSIADFIEKKEGEKK
jgi:site-specific DNA-methyltransferase (adenine-specific)